MEGQPFWGWFGHRMEDLFRKNCLSDTSNGGISSTSEQDVQIDSQFNTENMCPPMGGLSIVYSFGGCHQFPPVVIKDIQNDSAEKFTDSSDFIKRLDFRSFVNTPPADNTYSMDVVLEKVFWNRDPESQSFLKNVWQGTVTGNNVTLLMSITEINISPYYKDSFKDALHMMPQWRLTVSITVDHLRNIDTPVTKLKIHYNTITTNATNHALKECSHPKLGALTTVATVMLLRKYIVEQCLVDGSVDCDKIIVYRSPTGPQVGGSLPDYVAFNQPKLLVREDNKLFPDKTGFIATYPLLSHSLVRIKNNFFFV